MTLSIDISVDDRPARRFLRGLVMALDQPGIRAVAGRAGVNKIQKHLRELDRARPNKLGGRRSHFYSASAASTHYQVVSDGVIVSVTHQGIAQRYFGGVIRPSGKTSRATGKPITRLAIPSRPESYGVAPAEIEGLFVMRSRSKNRAALVRREGSSLRVYYWLVSSVTQRPDPSVMPTDDELHSEATRAVDSYIERQIERAAQ